MIRFACPTCQKILKAPDEGGGRKISCPRCGQRLLVPNPEKPAASNKTVLGEPLPFPNWLDDVRAAEEKSKEPSAPSVGDLTVFTVFCPDCKARLLVDDAQSDGEVECPKCGRRFAARGSASAAPDPPPASTAFSGLEDRAGSNRVSHLSHEFHGFEKEERKHSGLGTASFIIALLVGGLDVILALIVVIGIARSGHHKAGLKEYQTYRRTSREDLEGKVLAGGMAMVCLNCMSVPLCLVGVGLALVGLIAHRDCNHMFTWIGLIGNGVVILGMVGMYVVAALLGG